MSQEEADAIRARMIKLAAARSSGVLRVSGEAEGAIYFSQGQVFFARSQRIPGPPEPAVSQPAIDQPAVGQPAVGQPPGSRLGQVQGVLLIAESIVDAVVDLLSGSSACRRFRATGPSRSAPACSIAVGDLLAEATRQQRRLQLMSTAVTPDTVVRRRPQLGRARVQVSWLQWALLIRVQGGATPRELARELGRTVFGTTTDVYELIVLGLLGTDRAAATPGGVT
jgi:hypothetical protein